MALSKRRVSPSRAHSNMDLRETLNDKRNREGDLCAKLNSRTSTALDRTVIPSRSIAYTAKSIPRYQMSFSRDIEGMDPPEKFTPPKFTLYDGKLDPRLHVSHVKQMVAL